MEIRFICLLLLFRIVFSGIFPFENDFFSEKVYIKPLPQDGKVVTIFNFTLVSQSQSNNHFQLFPKRFFQLINKHSVSSFNLTFSQGRWEYSKWGISPQLNEIISPSGVQLSALFEAEKIFQDLQNWKSFVHALSGLFCTSLNFLDLETKSYASGIVFASKNHFYGTLSKESVCTENLTPVKSLIPSKKGLVEVLNPLKLFDCFFYTMSVKYSNINNGNERKLEVGIAVVYNFESGNKLKKYTFGNLFGKSLSQASPVASESMAYIQIDSDNVFKQMKVNPEEFDTIENEGEGKTLIFNLKKVDFSKFSIDWKKKISVLEERKKVDKSKKHLTPIEVHKFHTYTDQIYGKISLHFENFVDEDLEVEYFDVIPSYFKVYTNSFYLNEKRFSNFSFEQFDTNFCISFRLKLPKKSFTRMYFDVENSFLTNNEHPPDASRGFDLSSSIVKYCFDDNCFNYFTESLLITIPIPDLSMPFNVMMISATFLSLFFVTMISMFMKRSSWKLKLHLLKVIEKVDKNFKFSKDFVLSKNEDLMEKLIQFHFQTEIIYRNRRISGQLLFRKYYKSSVKVMLAYFSKSIRKMIDLSIDYKEKLIYNQEDNGEMIKMILKGMKDRIVEKKKEKKKTSMLNTLKMIPIKLLSVITRKNEFSSFLKKKSFIQHLPLDIRLNFKQTNKLH